MSFTIKDRNLYSVIDVARTLRSYAIGSDTCFDSETEKNQSEWLAWRIGPAWVEPLQEKYRAYDTAVRQMAHEALIAWKNRNAY